MKVWKIILSFILLLFWNTDTYSQKIKNLYINTGIFISSGTTQNRIGFFIGGYYIYKQFQINLTIRPTYNIFSLGTGKESSELHANLSLVYGYGGIDSIKNNFVTEISNQTGRKNSVAISYNAYIDNIETSQFTGTIALEFNKFGIIHENDMWGEPRSDRFRSAGIQLYYRTKQIKYATNVILWHGNAFAKGSKSYTKTDYPARWGFKDFNKSKYGKFSNGIWSTQVNLLLPNMQVVNFDIGIDSEKVRHMVQNRFTHDMCFLPDKLVINKLLHYPMIDDKGNLYLFKKNQKIKPSTFYLNLAFNQNLFY